MSFDGEDYARSKGRDSRSGSDYGKLSETERAWFLVKGAGLMSLSKAFEEGLPDGMRVTEVRVKMRKEGSGYVTIVKGMYEGQKYVSFAGGDTVPDALAETGKKLRSKHNKWREDQWPPDNAA
jgi:hypothetical protein